MNISSFDLNLLRVFDMLMREQNVSRAAERLALTQPTVAIPHFGSCHAALVLAI